MVQNEKKSFGGSLEKIKRSAQAELKRFFGQFCQKNKNFVRRIAEKKVLFPKIRTLPPQMTNGRPHIGFPALSR